MLREVGIPLWEYAFCLYSAPREDRLVMVRNYGLFVCGLLVWFVSCLQIAHPQNSAEQALSRGVFVTPVPGLPFSAVVEQEMTQVLKDGTAFQRRTVAFIARDVQGRIHNESHEVLPSSSSRPPALLTIHIYDPYTRLNTFLDVRTHIARQSTLSNPPETVPPANWAQRESADNPTSPNAQFEDLGVNALEGIEVHGYRRTMTLSARASGTGQPVAIMDEYWYSEELRLNLLASHSDPRVGKLTITVRRLTRDEPSADLFEVPPGYKLVDMTPPQ
jgi:hypothetical protein